MKNTITLLVMISLSFNLYAQEEKVELKKIQLDIGYMYLSNSLNGDNYYKFKYNGAPNTEETSMSGINTKFTMPSKNEYIDIVFGSLLLIGNDKLGSTSWSPGQTNSYDYKLNGGGIYFGVSTKLKGKYIGLTSDFTIGVFSFKEYLGIFNNTQEPFTDVYEKKASNGLGAMSSLGFYIKLGRFGINPSVNALYSGGSQTSFLFYGFVVPITFQF